MLFVNEDPRPAWQTRPQKDAARCGWEGKGGRKNKWGSRKACPGEAQYILSEQGGRTEGAWAALPSRVVWSGSQLRGWENRPQCTMSPSVSALSSQVLAR